MIVVTNARAWFYPVTQPLDGSGRMTNPTEGFGVVDGLATLCYYEESTPGTVFQEIGVVLRQPAFLQLECEDALGKVTPTDPEEAPQTIAEVGINGRLIVYVVRCYVEMHEAGNDADHADIYLERPQYPPAAHFHEGFA